MAKKRPSGRAPGLRKGERTRQAIVEAAAPVFNQHGYEGSSMSELMEATGLKKGGIYRHFESKEELAAAAFDYTWEAARLLRTGNVDPTASGLTKVRQLVANFVSNRSHIAGGCPILNTAIEADDGNLEVLRSRALKALTHWLDWVQAAVAEAIEAGEARESIDPGGVATIVVATLEGALMIGRLQQSALPLRYAQDHLLRYLNNEVVRS